MNFDNLFPDLDKIFDELDKKIEKDKKKLDKKIALAKKEIEKLESNQKHENRYVDSKKKKLMNHSILEMLINRLLVEQKKMFLTSKESLMEREMDQVE